MLINWIFHPVISEVFLYGGISLSILHNLFSRVSLLPSLDPLSRFFSQYDEAYVRTTPWQTNSNTPHPFPYLYENIHTYVSVIIDITICMIHLFSTITHSSFGSGGRSMITKISSVRYRQEKAEKIAYIDRPRKMERLLRDLNDLFRNMMGAIRLTFSE